MGSAVWWVLVKEKAMPPWGLHSCGVNKKQSDSVKLVFFKGAVL